MKFLIITPAKNEAEYIRGLIESMIDQDILPEKWVIVDDASDDGMAEIVEEYTTDHPWISLVRRETSSAQRSGGSKVVRVFYEGYDRFRDVEHDVVMKLDADLTLPHDYLLSLKEEFEKDRYLGLCGGYCVIPTKNGWKREASHSHHVRGALKAYRKDCFYEMGGLTRPGIGMVLTICSHASWLESQDH